MKVEHVRVQANGVGLHAAFAGRGRPLVLLHGWPVTWYHWRRVLPALAERHLVVAPDLRGLGDSERAAGGYDKQNLAADVAALLDVLDVRDYALVGHDFGGSVACALAAAHRDRVTHLVVEEVLLPGCPAPASLLGGRYPRWHGGFHATPGLPEALITGRELEYLRFFWSLTADGTELPPDAVHEFARTYLSPGTLRAGLAYYRTARADAVANSRLGGDPLVVPTLAIGGEAAMGRAVEASVRRVCKRVTGVVLDACGHYPAQERPEAFADLVTRFLAT